MRTRARLLALALSWPVAAFAADAISDQAAIDTLRALILQGGFSCPRIIVAFAAEIDEYGNQFRVVCPGSTIEGTRFRVSVNPETKRVKVQSGW